MHSILLTGLTQARRLARLTRDPERSWHRLRHHLLGFSDYRWEELAAGLTNSFSRRESYRLAEDIARGESLPAGSAYTIELPRVEHPIVLRAGTSDLKVFEQIFCARELAAFDDRPLRTVLDLGANIGLASIFLKLRHPECRIVSVEFDPSNFAQLKRNTAPYPDIFAVHAAAWFERSTLRVADPTVEAFARRPAALEGCDGQHAEAVESVPALPIECFCQWLGTTEIDLVKIDIEGSEFEIFSRPTNAWLQSTRVVAIETHDRFVAGCSEVVSATFATSDWAHERSGEYEIFERRSDVG